MFLNGITNGMSVAHLKKVKGIAIVLSLKRKFVTIKRSGMCCSLVVMCSSKKTITNEKKHTLREGD